MLSHDAHGAVMRFWEEVYNQSMLESVEDLVAEEFALNDIGAGSSFDRYTVQKLVTDIHDMIQEFRVTVDEQFEAAGNRVVSRLTFSARKPNAPVDYEEPPVILMYSGVAISQVPGDRIDRIDLLWESMRAETELEPAEDWRWPPWS
jgi:hypothetical protein